MTELQDMRMKHLRRIVEFSYTVKAEPGRDQLLLLIRYLYEHRTTKAGTNFETWIGFLYRECANCDLDKVGATTTEYALIAVRSI